MIHDRRGSHPPERPRGGPSRGRPRVTRRGVGVLAAVAGALLALAACGGDTGTPPEALRFGQVGEITVHLQVPLRGNAPVGQPAEGRLDQIINWGSSGAWTLQETILYKGVVGDGDFTRNPGSTSQFAGAYFSLIAAVNDQEGLQLDIPGLTQDSVPPCASDRTTVTFAIHDEARNKDKSWTECAQGSLANLTTEDAGPDTAAARVPQAAILARNYTVGEDFVSAYAGSVPFATIDRGENTPAVLTAPLAITNDVDWDAFWLDHSGGKSAAPAVNFDSAMVIVAAVGKRDEAGDSVEVRRILQIDNGTLVHIWERIPGDFCSPVARSHTPFHIVVSPRTPAPIRFAEIHPDTVRCGAQGG